MERLGLRVDDVRKVGQALSTLFNKPIRARLYYNERTCWQDLDFMGLVTSNDQPQTASSATQAPDDSDDVQFGF